MLYRCVEQHLPGFLERCERAQRPLPRFVEAELRGFLDCGILERGCARVRCPCCGFDRLVAFSCKGRGFCPSCGARRMAETAAFLVDEVIPHVPMRQWVLSLPPPLRYLLAYDSELLGRVLGIFVHAVFAHLRAVAKRELDLPRLADAHPGAVCVPQRCVPQRFGSAVNLHPHLHALVFDGVFVQASPDEPPRFRALPPPSRADIAQVAWSVCQRTVALLRQRGMWLDADPSDDPLAQQEPMLASLAAASISGTLALGPGAGKRVMRLYGTAARRDRRHGDDDQRSPPRNAYGFDLHAGVRTSARDRRRLERLCRYLLRPPLANDRLRELGSGRYAIRLKTPWHDGTTHVVLAGEELVGRLAVLVPPPRVHTIRYFGVLAPHARLRRRVVPGPRQPDARRGAHRTQACDSATPSRCRRHMSWAALLKRVWDIDVLECPRCRARMQQVAVVVHPATVRQLIAGVTKATGPP